MKSHGIFRDVHQEVGEIIVADVNQPRIDELLAPDREALRRLIRKEDLGRAIVAAPSMDGQTVGCTMCRARLKKR